MSNSRNHVDERMIDGSNINDIMEKQLDMHGVEKVEYYAN